MFYSLTFLGYMYIYRLKKTVESVLISDNFDEHKLLNATKIQHQILESNCEWHSKTE